MSADLDPEPHRFFMFDMSPALVPAELLLTLVGPERLPGVRGLEHLRSIYIGKRWDQLDPSTQEQLREYGRPVGGKLLDFEIPVWKKEKLNAR